MKDAIQVLSSIINEKDGFSFGEAINVKQANLDVIVPIIRNKRGKRKYNLLAEARDIEIRDTGKIDNVYVKNNEDKPLLITKGDIFQGKTQERAAVHTYIIEPGKGCNIHVNCVHHSRGISSNAPMAYAGKAPYYVDFSNQGKTWESIRSCGKIDNISQPQMWPRTTYYTQDATPPDTLGDPAPIVEGNEGISGRGERIEASAFSTFTTRQPFGNANVGYYTSAGIQGGVHSKGSDDLVNQLQEKKKKMQNVLKMIPRKENQVGVIFIDNRKIRALEAYDLESAWAFIQEDVISKEGSDFIEDPEVDLFDFVPDRLKKYLDKKLTGFEYKTLWEQDEYKVIELRNKEMIGEMAIIGNDFIYLSIVRI